jgi:hypothetical protein
MKNIIAVKSIVATKSIVAASSVAVDARFAAAICLVTDS